MQDLSFQSLPGTSSNYKPILLTDEINFMGMEVKDGDTIVLCENIQELKDGDACFVILKTGEKYFRLYKSYQGETFLYNLNGEIIKPEAGSIDLIEKISKKEMRY